MGDNDQYLSAIVNDQDSKILNIKPNKKLYISTLNCLTLRTQERLTELELALLKIKWDILGLSEVRRLGENIEERNEYIFYYIGKTKGRYGVGFMVKKHLKNNILEFKGISERIAMLSIHLPGYKHIWTIIQIYAPTEQQDEPTKDLFYDQLSSVLQNRYKNVIVIGDFNGRIGSQRIGEENIVGKYGYGRRSKNGERMIKIAVENNLAFMNSFFKKRLGKRWTWISPDGLFKNEIDYIATNNTKVFQNVSILNQFDFNTNHRMVRAVIEYIEPKKNRQKFHSKVNSIQNQHLYTILITEVDEKYTKEISKIYSLPFNKFSKPKSKPTNTESLTKTLIEERRERIKLGKDKQNLKIISDLSKKISNSIKKDNNKKRITTLNNYIKKTGGVKKALKDLTDTTIWIPKVINKVGKEETNRKSIIQTATNFYRRLYKAEENSLDLGISLDDVYDSIEDTPVFHNRR